MPHHTDQPREPAMATLETDYLVIGAGATGLAFADTLLQQGDAHITLVDLHARPGGHWNDAYPFVALHQPSAFYGVNSLELGTGRKDTVGHNAGLYELASGAEVCGYFQQVMQQRLLPSGRVHHLPMTRFLGMADGAGRVASVLSGAESQIRVRRKLVDARWFSPSVPATTRPKFSVTAGVRLVTPTGLTQLWQDGQERPSRFCILGAGKTAMDVGVWLLTCGAPPDAIHWVMPRDSWVVNRLTTQPGDEFFMHSIGGQVQQMQAIAEASDLVDLFERLEDSGQMLRIDRSQRPRMFHYATMSEGEVQLLRQITQVIRQGRVQAIEPGALVLDQGRVPMEPGTLYIDCTASAVEVRAMEPMFQPGRILPQLVRAPLVSFSSAVCAYVEANFDDDAVKNRLCTPVPFPRSVGGFVAATMASLANQLRWGEDKAMRHWIRESRLDGFGKMVAAVDRNDAEKMSLLGELRQQGAAAMANARRLMAAAG
jgi:hypothetical protein